MNALFKIVALIGFLLTAAAPVLTFLGPVDPDLNRMLMVVGMILWFAGATPWLGRRALRQSDTEVEI